jgi:hypothetical protein
MPAVVGPLVVGANTLYVDPATGLIHPAIVVAVNADATYNLNVFFQATYTPPVPGATLPFAGGTSNGTPIVISTNPIVTEVPASAIFTSAV